MGPLRHLDDRDLDRLIAGRGIEGDPEAGDLAGLVDDVRATHLRPVAQDTRERHLAAMAQTARLTPSTDPLPSVPARRSLRSLMPRNRFAAITAAIAATTVTIGLGSAGLAVAGVNLPDPASTAFERLGLSLPNQATESERSEQERQDAVRAVIDATPPSERRGCAFGQRVAEAARGEALPAEAKERCAEAEERRAEREDEEAAEGAEPADGQEEAVGAAERDSFGAETSQRAREQGTASPQERRQFGQDTAERARQRARDRGANAGGSPDRQARPAPSEQAPRGQGAPDSAGPPAGVSPGRPDFARPPAGSGSGGPEGAGPPEGAGRPGGAGR
jgi:hypothetical protein